MTFLSYMWANLGNKCSHIVNFQDFEKVLYPIVCIFKKKKCTIPQRTLTLSPYCMLPGLSLSICVPPAAYQPLLFLITNNGKWKKKNCCLRNIGKRLQKVQWCQELRKTLAWWVFSTRVLKPYSMGFEGREFQESVFLCYLYNSHFSLFASALLIIHPDIW